MCLRKGVIFGYSVNITLPLVSIYVEPAVLGYWDGDHSLYVTTQPSILSGRKLEKWAPAMEQWCCLAKKVTVTVGPAMDS